MSRNPPLSEPGKLATVGRKAAVIAFGRLRLKGWLAWWIWGKSAHIYFLISLRNRLTVATQWLWSLPHFRARHAAHHPAWVDLPSPTGPVVEPMMLDPRTDKERLEAPAQWGHAYVKFKNDNGVPEIRVGVKEFKCIGVSPPQDHPHIYLVMGNDDTLLCPYCATLFRFDPRLGPDEADPPDCLFIDKLGE